MKIFGLGVLLLNLMVQNYPVVAYEPESLSIYKTIAAHESSALEAAYRAVKNKLASKVFLMPNTSVIWGARLPQDDEVLMLTIGKTTQLNDIMNVIDYKRPFTGFEVVASRISDGCLPYLDWATTYASGNITAATLTDEERKLESEFAAQVMSQKYENTSLVDTTESKVPQDEIKVAEENKDEEDKEDDDDEEEDEAAQKEKEDEERGITEADDEYEDEQEEEEEAEREKEEEKRQAQSRTKMQANDQRERNYADYYEQDGMQDIKRRGPYRAQGQRRPRDPNRAKMPDNEVNYANPPYDDYAEAPPARVRESNRARGQRRQRAPNGYRMPNNQYDDAPLYDDYIAAAGVTPIRRGYRRRPTATAAFRTAIVQEMAPTKHQLNENDVVIDVHSVQTVEEDPVAEMKKAEATTIAKATKRAKGVTKEKKVAKKATATKVAKAKAPRKTMAKSKSRKARVTIERPQAYAKNYRTLPSGDGLYVAKRRLRTIARPVKSRMYARQRALIPVQPSNSRSFALLRAQPSNSRNPPLVFPQPSNLRIFPMFRSQQRPRKFAILRAQPAYPRNFPVARVMPANPPNFAVVRSQPIRSRNFPVARARIANSRNFQRPNYRNVPALPALPAMQPRWPVLSDLRAR